MVNMNFGEFEYSEEELQKQFEEATQRAAEDDRHEPRAAQAYYDEQAGRIVVTLTNRVIISFPLNLLQGLADASPDELAAVRLSPHGTALHWDKLDVDFSVPGLVAQVFGTRAWMAELGRKGGRITSDLKAAAARVNGQKGGRPRQIGAPSTFPKGWKAQPFREDDELTTYAFEAKLVASHNLRPTYTTQVLEAVPRLAFGTLEKVSRLLEEDVGPTILSSEQEVIEGQMVQHPIPIILKEGIPFASTLKFHEGETSELESIG